MGFTYAPLSSVQGLRAELSVQRMTQKAQATFALAQHNKFCLLTNKGEQKAGKIFFPDFLLLYVFAPEKPWMKLFINGIFSELLKDKKNSRHTDTCIISQSQLVFNLHRNFPSFFFAFVTDFLRPLWSYNNFNLLTLINITSWKKYTCV